MHDLIRIALEENRNPLENEASCLLRDYGIRVPDFGIATSGEEACLVAREIGFPVALKVMSPGIIHKSDVGGVILNLSGAGEVTEAYSRMMSRISSSVPSAKIVGVLVSRMVTGLETVVGVTQDPTFGPVIMFGLGGILVEAFKDVSFRAIPIQREDAEELIAETKASRLFEGMRGKAPMDRGAAADVLVRVSQLVTENPRIREMDINPLMVMENGAVAVDVRIMLEREVTVT